MATRTAAAATHSRIHRTMFLSSTLHQKHFTNFVLCCIRVNNLKHPCHYVGSQTALDPTVSSANLLTVLLHQCVPLPCDHPGNTHVQSNTAPQHASTAYGIGFSWGFTALALSTYNVTSLPFPLSSPSRRSSQSSSLVPSLAVINSASVVDNSTDHCS